MSGGIRLSCWNAVWHIIPVPCGLHVSHGLYISKREHLWSRTVQLVDFQCMHAVPAGSVR